MTKHAKNFLQQMSLEPQSKTAADVTTVAQSLLQTEQYKLQIKHHFNQSVTLGDNLAMMFSKILGQCTKAMKIKLTIYMKQSN